jgi:hypothetical protein
VPRRTAVDSEAMGTYEHASQGSTRVRHDSSADAALTTGTHSCCIP